MNEKKGAFTLELEIELASELHWCGIRRSLFSRAHIILIYTTPQVSDLLVRSAVRSADLYSVDRFIGTFTCFA